MRDSTRCSIRPCRLRLPPTLYRLSIAIRECADMDFMVFPVREWWMTCGLHQTEDRHFSAADGCCASGEGGEPDCTGRWAVGGYDHGANADRWGGDGHPAGRFGSGTGPLFVAAGRRGPRRGAERGGNDTQSPGWDGGALRPTQ